MLVGITLAALVCVSSATSLGENAEVALCEDARAELPGVELVQLQVSRVHSTQQTNASELSVVVDADAETEVAESQEEAAVPDALTQKSTATAPAAQAAPPEEKARVAQLVQQSGENATTMHKQVHAGAASLSEAEAKAEVARWSPFDEVMRHIVPTVDGAVSAAAQAAGVAFASVVNSSIIVIDEKADAFLESCAEYKDSLLRNVSDEGNRRIDVVQHFVNSHVGPVDAGWQLIVNTAGAAGPHVVRAIAGLGLDNAAAETQVALDKMLDIGKHISNVLNGTTNIVNGLGMLSKEEIAVALGELNTTVNYGLDEATAFSDNLALFVRHAIEGVAERIGISLTLVSKRHVDSPEDIKLTFQSLERSMGATVNKISSGLHDYLTGTLEAAELVLSETGERNPATRATVLAGSVLAAAVLGMTSWP